MGFAEFAWGFGDVSDEGLRNAQAQKILQSEAEDIASFKTYKRLAGQTAPMIRELEAMGAIPAFQQAAATGVARRGLTGTGLGLAITNAGGGAGELFALSRSLDEAARLQSLQLEAVLRFAGVDLGGPSRSSLRGIAAGNIAEKVVGGIFSMGSNVPNTPVDTTGGPSAGPGGSPNLWQQPNMSQPSGSNLWSQPSGISNGNFLQGNPDSTFGMSQFPAGAGF